MKFYRPTITSFALALLFVLGVVSCKKNEEPKDNWERVKYNAKKTVDAAADLSQEKWQELKAFTNEEWNGASESIEEFKKKIERLGEDAKPEIKEKIVELENLKKDVEEAMKDFSEATGEKAEASKEKLKALYEKLKTKVDSLKESNAV